jgi:peptidyl-prolyl cis-trans isomerase B (cyclophilin B)
MIMLKKFVLILVAAVLLLTAGCNFAFTTSGTTGNQTTVPATNNTGNSENGLNPSLKYYADIEIQNYGKITIQLEQNVAPITCANFVKLAESGFYNGLTFHRIMEGFMMQGGDPEGTGFGGSEETIIGEFAANGIMNTLSHKRGVISMARSSAFNSASSQFFIVHQDSTFLDGGYAAFGYVTEGMDVVDAICAAAKPTDNNGKIPADAQPVMTSVTIRTENGK